MIRSIVFILLSLGLSASAEERLPNVILFFVDDMGWTDVGYAGSDLYETPNIDALAAGGMKFTRAYAACTVCSPSRLAVLTGQYPARANVTDFIAGHPFTNTPLTIPKWTQYLDHDLTTIAEVLKTKDYHTASIGKWHLTPRDNDIRGKSFPDYYPEKHGFDRNIAGHEQGAPSSYFWPYSKGKSIDEQKQNNLYKTLPDHGEAKGEYLTDRLGNEAVSLINEWADDPFFFYFPFYNVHTPLMAKEEDIAYFEKKIKPDGQHQNAVYAAMVKSVDDAIGAVVTALEKKGVRDETLIIFTSDNGGLLFAGKTTVTTNLPVRNGKGSVYEGGVRVPAFVNWPGKVAAGSSSDEPVISMDWPMTIAAAVGGEGLVNTDGRSLLPILTGESDSVDRDALFWHYPHYHSMGGVPYSAVLKDGWRLIEFHHGPKLELYNLNEDVHEDHNLAESHSEKARELQQLIHQWRKSVDAQMPSKNAEYDPAKQTGILRGNRFRLSAPVRRD